MQTAAQNRQDYEDLVAELTTLSQSVAQHFKANKSNAMSDCVSGIVKWVMTKVHSTTI
jgi:hypothetical protein